MKLRNLLFILFFFCGYVNAQEAAKPAWTVEFSKSKSFIENLGQFDEFENESTGKIRYAIDLGSTRIFFGEKGVCYNFKEINKKSREERAEIMNQPVKTFEDHKQKERLVGKFLIKTDQVNMAWLNASNDVKISGESAYSDYHSYSFKDVNNELKNINFVKGFKTITYKNIYPNIDVKYEVHPIIGVKYAYIIHPGADPSQIQMLFDRDVKLVNGEILIPTLFGDIIDHSPITFYDENNDATIDSKYQLNNQNREVSFHLADFDKSRTIVIDPWVQTPVFPLNWDCVWELDTDAAGNVYIIGGVDPLQLKKYNSAGVLQWSYDTPYDTTEWLGTMATDDVGNSYVTNGTDYKILKVNTSGALVWSNNTPTGGQLSTEFWNIAFNCDQTKLLVGGTGGILDIHGEIYEIDMSSGNIVSSVQVTQAGNLFGIPPQIQEVRAMCAAPNGKYYFATLDTIGFISDNLSLCPNGSTSLLEKNHGVNWGYKSENWRYSNTGIKVIRADKDFVYLNKGNALQKRSLVDFSLIASVTIPGGVLSTPFLSDNVTENAGIDIDDCGNIYVGSKTGVYKFNSSLVQQAFYATSFTVYDVRVSSSGDIVACGGTGNSSSSTRSGGVQSFAASACAPIALTCCNTSFCFPTDLCANSSPVQLTPATPGGTWSGVGVNSSGLFDPASAGIGPHLITYTIGCGSETISILVGSCTTLQVCEETNGNMTVSGGTGPYTWTCTVTTSTTSNDCATCGGIPFFGSCLGATLPCTITNTSTVVLNGTTVTLPANTTSVSVADNGGTTLVFDPNTVTPCTSSCPTITVSTTSQTNVTCFGQTNGSATVSASGGTGPYTYTWTPGNLNGATQTGLSANVYTVNVVDANLCPGSTTVNITQPAAVAAPTASVTAQPTCSVATGTITVTVPAPAAGVTYTVTGTAPVVAAQTNATGIFSGLAAGNYSVITTVNGCTSTATSLTVNAQPATPAAPTASVTTQPTCSTPTGTITVTVPSPAGGTTYTVTGTAPVVAPQTNSTGVFSGLAAGNYNVITTVGGCPSAATPLTVNPAVGAPSAPTASVTQPTCSTATGSITVTAPAPAGGTTFTLTGTAPVVAPQTNSTGIFTNLASGNYTVIVTVAGCSSSPTPLTVNAQPATPSAPTATLTQPTCSVGTGTITVTVPAAGAGVSYTVAGTSPVVAPQTNSTGIFSGLAPGTYSVMATVNGCNSPLTSLTVNAQPATPAAPTASVTTLATCPAPTGTITVTVPTPAAGTTYTVTGTAPVVAAQTNATGVFSGLNPGTYNVTTTVGGCTSTVTVIVVSPPLGAPTISVVSTTDVTCNGGTDGAAVVSGSGGTGALTYSWSPGGLTGTSQSALDAGTYTVTVTDASGCSNNTSLTINEPSQITIAETITNMNCGAFDGAISVVASGGAGSYTYSWTPNGETTSSLSGLTPGSYSVTVTDVDGCDLTESYTVGTTGSLAVVAIPPSSTIDEGDSVQLNVTGGTTYSWAPTTGLSCSTCDNPIASPLVTTTYIVTGTDASGCTGADTLIVIVLPYIEPCGELFIPTVLAPDGTGSAQNKSICVYGGCVSELTFAIYSRWGEKVFETSNTDLSECWDGTYKGKPMNAGVFAYKLIVTLTNGDSYEESGNITLVR